MPESRRNSLFRGTFSAGRSWAVQGVNWAVYEARVSVLTEAAMTALSRRRCAHIVVQARASRSLVAAFCVVWGPPVSKVTPSVLTVL